MNLALGVMGMEEKKMEKFSVFHPFESLLPPQYTARQWH